jgi:hypothetical protein
VKKFSGICLLQYVYVDLNQEVSSGLEVEAVREKAYAASQDV